MLGILKTKPALIGNTQNEAIKINSSSIWFLQGKPIDAKDITRVYSLIIHTMTTL